MSCHGAGRRAPAADGDAVRLEFPILLLHPGLRHRCVAPDRRHAVRQRRMAMPLRWKTSGLLGSRRAHAATNRQAAANRALIGRSSAVYWPFIGCEGARQRFTHVAVAG